jgi:diguanylate cyclase (GGDEF)-like protein
MSSYALIIEDDQDTASLFSHILEFIGFQTEIIRSPERVFTQLDHTIPDIVLLDIMLGQNVSGINILDYIKNQDRLSTCRVIVITGYPNLVETIEDRADLVLLKPISAKQLSTMVLRMVPNHVSESFLYNASHDPLTGLMNYACFKDRLAHAVNRSRRTENLFFGLILILIENYSTLQKVHGPHPTNLFLEDFVGRITREIREVDTCGRLTENKFGILLEDIKAPANAFMVADRIKSAIASPLSIQGKRLDFNARVEVIEMNTVHRLDDFLQRPS